MITKTLKAGAARRCINVPEEMIPYPSARMPVCEGIYTDLHVRALVIDNGETETAVLSFDLGGFHGAEDIKAFISEGTGIPAEHIITAATHNHTACDMVWAKEPEEKEAVRRYQSYIREQALSAVKAAREAVRPARYGYGEGLSYINVNRDLDCGNSGWTQGPNYALYSDKTVSAAKFIAEDGSVIAAIVNYGMHATLGYMEVDADGKKKSSGNIPGAACDYVESRLGKGAVVLWTSAAAGDQNPTLFTLRDYDEKDGFPHMARLLPGAQYQLIRLLGKQHGEDILKVLNSVKHYNHNMPVAFAENTIELPTHRIADGRHEMELNGLANALERLPEGEEMPETTDTGETVPVYMQQAVLGDIAIVGIAAEIYSLIGKAMKEASPFRHTMVVTHVGPSAGYILDKTSISHRCFQYYSRVKPGSGDESIVENELELFDQMRE